MLWRIFKGHFNCLEKSTLLLTDLLQNVFATLMTACITVISSVKIMLRPDGKYMLVGCSTAVIISDNYASKIAGVSFDAQMQCIVKEES